jgi:hypothetical protein
MVEAAEHTLLPTAEKAVFPFGHWALGIGHFPNCSSAPP